VISVEGLTKRYDGTVAVDGISFQVEQGQILGFLGPNGAGKTTTMKIITCYMPPTSGDVVIDGQSVLEHSLEIRRRLGYLPEHTPLYDFMPVLDYLEFVAEMRGLELSARPRRIREMIEVCGLGEVLARDIGELSKGYRQRVGLAQTLIHDPDLVILDEPTSGLDPNQIVEIRSLIREIGRQKTLILSTHILPEVTATCDRVIIINRGRLVADGSPDELAGSLHGRQHLRVGFATGEGFEPAPIAVELGRVPGVAKVGTPVAEGPLTLIELESAKETDPRLEIFRLAAARGWPLAELHLERSSLEDIFRELTVGAETESGSGRSARGGP
jgi:ABC-2 type transport system ATP-binding protein